MASRSKYGNALDAIGDTPLVKLSALEPDDGASIYVKWEGANPTGSLKDRMALAMVLEGKRKGNLQPGEPVIEFTGGSTGTSLALVCSVLDHPLHIVTADCVADEKIESMRALGAQLDVIETPNGSAYDGLFEDLRDITEEKETETDGYFTDQFNNPDQLQGYKMLGEEILEQVPDVDDFAMIVGTGGCAMGTTQTLREHSKEITSTFVEPEESPVLSDGSTGTHSVQGTAIVGSPPLVESDVWDQIVTLPAQDGAECVKEIAEKEGLLVGTSSGMNVAAARQIAANRTPDESVVTIACDTGLKYLSDDIYSGKEDSSTFCLC